VKLITVFNHRNSRAQLQPRKRKGDMDRQAHGSVGWFLLAGSINLFLAVGLGAFGAHALKASLAPDLMAVFQTGNQYHFYHALGLFAGAVAAGRFPTSRLIRLSGALMLAGLVLFSGSLYVLSLTGQRWMGMITPVGGTAFLAAWLAMAVGVWKEGRPDLG
jgi:uncharacterized membrane protein YgdD (TMEM256/DUF423 family)